MEREGPGPVPGPFAPPGHSSASRTALWAGLGLIENLDNRLYQDRRWDRLPHVFAFAAGALDVVVAAVDDERDLPPVQPVAYLGGIAVIERVIEDGGRQIRTLDLAEGIAQGPRL